MIAFRRMFSRIAAGVLLFVSTGGYTNAQFSHGYDHAAYDRAIAESDQLVTSGRVGPIRVGMYMDEVVTILGPPETVKHCSSEAYFCIASYEPSIPGLSLPAESKANDDQLWYYDGKRFRVLFHSASVPAVLSVSIFHDPRFVTEQGLKVGMSTFDAARIYGAESIRNPYRHPVCLGPGSALLIHHDDSYKVSGFEILSLPGCQVRE